MSDVVLVDKQRQFLNTVLGVARDAAKGSIRVRLMIDVYHASDQIYREMPGSARHLEMTLNDTTIQRIEAFDRAVDAFTKAVANCGFEAVTGALTVLSRMTVDPEAALPAED